jgi:cytochrome c oxidase subunit 2
VLDPGGPFSSSITTLSWVLIALMTFIVLFVFAALWVALFGGKQLREKLGGEKTVLWLGLYIPTAILAVLLVSGLWLTSRLSGVTGDEPRIQVSGNNYWWRVAYLDAEGNSIIHDANELHIPVGQPVVLELTSEDVIHSFWVPRLGGKMDMIPGRVNTLRLQADEPGIYGGHCAEYCGGAHSLMGFVVVAHDQAEWQRWLAQRQVPTAAPATAEAARGAQLFTETGCAACHRIEGTDAQGLSGPDLTYIGSRRSIGAGILPNNRGTLTGWIGDSQSIKPNNRMPAYRSLGAEELNALAAYMESLR